MPIPIPPALQGFTAFNQWLNYRLTPQPGGKLKKEAVGRGGYRVSPVDPAEWMTYDDAAATGLPLAFCFSENDPFFFLDIDNALVSHDRWSDRALQLLRDLPGVAVEISSSGRGLHLFGVMVSRLDHSNRRDDLGLEFYTRDRFVALTGNMLTPDGSVFHAPPELPALVAEYFPPSAHTAATDWTNGPCDGWAGPTDDDELVRRASRHVSASAAFAGRATFADLWAGNAEALAHAFPSSTSPYDGSSADAALCAHLAFWTGKDCERMARLLRASGLARDKHDRQDYIERTILRACGLVTDVLRDKPLLVIDPAARTEGYAFGSDDYLAALFVSAASNRFRWSDQLGWMYKRAHHWEPDRAAAYRAMTEICKQVAKAEEAHKLRPRLGANKTKNDALAAASNSFELHTPLDRWDSADMLICTPAGVYDLEAGALVEGEHLFTTVTAVAPSSMPTPIWDKFLHDVFDGDAEMIAFIHRLCGYLITGSVEEQKLFFFYGSTGGNGKSVLMDTLRDILSGYACRLPTDALMASFNERHPTSLASLRGKRLATSSEADAKKSWNEPLLKELTGEATLTARKMRQDDFEFRQTQKHVIMGNSRPKLRGEDGGIARRFVLVEFTQTFTGARRDNSLRQKLKAEYPGILSWLIDGAKIWRADGLRIPAEVQDSSSQYLDEQNDIKRWIDEKCAVLAGHSELGAMLLNSFRVFKSAAGEEAPSEKEFYERLRSAGYKSDRSNKGTIFKGLQLI
ncbi:hypothetical protein P608_05860 [Comamonas thiooxydans]|uniref:SF3 helicase domain-containing protein n=1 Tax=Comamonas thiooxydans TaxID=363952 RepID=A0A0E3C468_9BURK|nr:hypothetical protein P608_05860 [Comamonas thiooxydans]KGH23763.1 hypothetical protein P606_10730 [Comamonas thiooxydans]KGH24899.1 hypothetical protein P607_05695 [Comamonas thiooxydans]